MKIKNTKKCETVKVVCKKAAKAAAEKPVIEKPGKKEVTFTLHGEKGQEVYVAGEFNGWDPTAKKLAFKVRQGIYTTTMKLAPGSYQYKFVIDGTWCADPENESAVPNDQGTFNSVITVK